MALRRRRRASGRRRQGLARARRSFAWPCHREANRDRQSSARLSSLTGPVALGNALPRTCRETSPRQSTARHRGPAIDFIRTSFYTLPGIARWPMPLQGYRAEVFEEICEEAMAQEAANKATSPAAFLAWPREHQPFGEPLTSDLHCGPCRRRRVDGRRRQGLARARQPFAWPCHRETDHRSSPRHCHAIVSPQPGFAHRPGRWSLATHCQELAERLRRGNLRRDTKALPSTLYGPAFTPFLA